MPREERRGYGGAKVDTRENADLSSALLFTTSMRRAHSVTDIQEGEVLIPLAVLAQYLRQDFLEFVAVARARLTDYVAVATTTVQINSTDTAYFDQLLIRVGVPLLFGTPITGDTVKLLLPVPFFSDTATRIETDARGDTVAPISTLGFRMVAMAAILAALVSVQDEPLQALTLDSASQADIPRRAMAAVMTVAVTMVRLAERPATSTGTDASHANVTTTIATNAGAGGASASEAHSGPVATAVRERARARRPVVVEEANVTRTCAHEGA